MSENTFLKNIPGILRREKLRPNTRLGIFFIFIGIATLIWFLWTLEKEYSTIISNPIEFVGMPDDLILVNELPDKIQMEVKGRGYAILRHNWDITKSHLKIDFGSLYKGNPDDISEPTITIPLQDQKARLSNQLANIQVNSILPDAISFTFARMVKKKVPVIADLDLQIEKQYMIRGDIKITPDSIEISGPSTLLDTIYAINTAPLKLRKVDSRIQRNLALVDLHNKVNLSKKRVQIEVPIEQYTEKNIEIMLNGINVPDSLLLKVFPASVLLTFRVVVSEFENIQPEDFNLVVDYEKTIDGTPSKLAVQVLNYPDFIENLKFNPESVTYILENK